MTRFVSNSLFGALAGLTATLSGLASNIVIARLLGLGGTGDIAVAAWIATTAVTIFGLGIPATLSRYLPSLRSAGHSEEGRHLVGRLFVRLLVAISIPVVLLLVAGSIDGGALGASLARRAGLSVLCTPTRYALVAMLCFSWALVEYVRAYFRGVQDFRQLAMITMVSAVCQIGVLIGAAKSFGVSGVLAAYILGALIIVAPLAWIRPRPSRSAARLPRLRRYALFRWASEINAAFVWSRIEVVFLQVAGGATQVGLFTVGLTLVNLVVQGIQMLSWGLLPHFCEQHGRVQIDDMRRTFEVVVRIMALTTCPMCLGLAAITPELVPFMFGSHFAGSVPSAMVLVVGAVIIGPGTVAVTVAWAMERSDIEFFCGMLGVGVALVGGFTLIPTYGLIGAAVARVATQLTFVVVCNVYLIRAMRFRFPMSDLARILLASLGCAAVARFDLSFVWRGAAGMPSAVLAGAATYGLMLRLLQLPRAEEMSRLSALGASLPRPLAAPFRVVLRFVGETGDGAFASK